MSDRVTGSFTGETDAALRGHRTLLLTLLISFATVGAQWSSTLLLPVTAGAITAPGGVTSGLSLWIDASEPSTLDGTPQIRFWVDKAGHGHHLSAVTPSSAPYATVVSGKSQAIFEDSVLALSSSIPLEPMTAFFVIRNGLDLGYLPLLGRIDRGSGFIIDARRARMMNNGASTLSGIFGSVLSSGIVMLRTNSGSSDAISLNGGTELTFSWSSTDSATYVGAIWSATGTRYLRASLSEVAIWDRALTSAERTAVLRALGSKWGITVP
jgi:hypothetical protein